MSNNFKVGDAVVVKPGIQDPDLGGDISGWQGRILEVEHYEKNNSTMILFHWDSITLENMPESVIHHCEREGLSWAKMRLPEQELAPTKPRDTIKDVEAVKARIHRQNVWIGIGDDEAQGKRIQAVVNSADDDNDMTLLETWNEHLRDNLSLPFKAEIYEPQRSRKFRVGDKINVIDFSVFDDIYGLIVEAKTKHGKAHFPLCDLEVINEKSPNYTLVADYRLWFANR